MRIEGFILIAILVLGLVGITAGSSVEVVETEPATIAVTPTTTLIPYISQGDVVFIGDYIDVSGVVPPYPQLAYWDGADMYSEDPTYNITMPDSKKGYYRFYIDPDIFSTRLGRWYKYNNEFEKSGNNLAFIVKWRDTSILSQTQINGTIINETIYTEDYETVEKIETILPDKPVSDYLVARGAALHVPANETAAVWIFDKSTNNVLYAKNTSGFVSFNESMIWSLLPGSYSLILQKKAENAPNFDVIFDEGKNEIRWFDANNFDVQTESMGLTTPDIAVKKLECIFAHTRDRYQVLKLEIEDPVIQIVRMDTIDTGNLQEYYLSKADRGDVSVLDIRGYTNVPDGMTLSFTLDDGQILPKDMLYNTQNTTAVGDIGNMRAFQVYIPLFWDSLDVGMHTVSGSTPIGGRVLADFYVGELPADSFKPDTPVRYIGDRNPWVPTPTPEVILEKVEVPVTEYVTVEVTPPDSQVYAQQQRIEQERFDYYTGIAKTVFLAMIAIGIIGYFIVVFYRVKHE